MTVDLKIRVQGSTVTISTGGKTIVQTGAQANALGALASENMLTGDADNGNAANPEAGNAGNQAGIDPGGGPGAGRGAMVIGPIVLSGLFSSSDGTEAGAAANRAGIDPGGGPTGQAPIIIGPIVIMGGGGGAPSDLAAGTAIDVPAPAVKATKKASAKRKR